MIVRKFFVAAACVLTIACGQQSLPPSTNIAGDMIPPPRSGIAATFSSLMIPVPGARVNASGGNLYVQRSDMSVDTMVSGWSIGAIWNSADGEWRWNFDSTLIAPRAGQPPIFTDPSGYRAFLKGVSHGDPIPGTHWVSHDATSVRTSGGLVYRYDGDGLLESVNWISSDYPAIKLERAMVLGKSRVTSIEQCTSVAVCSTLYTMSFDVEGRIDGITDLAGREALYTYEPGSDRFVSVRDPLDVKMGWPGTVYEYDSQNRLLAKVNSHDERVEYGYFGSTNAAASAKRIGTGNPTWSFEYEGMKEDRDNAKSVAMDPLGNRTEVKFDIALRAKELTNPAGETWTWNWDGADLESHVSPSGIVTTFNTSEDRSVFTQTTASGNIITTTYAPSPAENRRNPYGRAVLQIEDSLGLLQSRVYTPQGILESITSGSGETTNIVFDPMGALVTTSSDGVATTFSNRGAHGNYLTVTRGSKIINHTFDLLGNLLTVDGLFDDEPSLHSLSIGQGGLISRSYDADRNIESITLTDSGGATQSELLVEWRADHREDKIIRPYGGDSDYVYDDLGRLSKERTFVNGSWVDTTFEYDLNGRRTATLRPNGMASRLTYRNAGEVASIRRERDWTDPNEVDAEVQFEFLNGRRIATRDQSHAMIPEQYFYNAVGEVDEIHFPGGEWIAYSYDLRGRLKTKEYRRPDDSLLRDFEYEYDLSNRRTAVIEDGVEIHSTTISNGRVTSEHYGNGVDVVYSYNAATGAKNGFVATNAGLQTVASMTVNTATCGIQLPAGKCIIEQTDTFRGVTSTSYAKYQTEDSGSERLIANSYGVTSPVDGFFDYDELSNLRTSPAGDFIYNSERNRLLEIEDGGSIVVDYTYDAAGYVVNRDGVSIVWNGMGRLQSLGSDFSKEWDALGRPVSATILGQVTNWKYGSELTEDDMGANQQLDLGWAVSDLDSSTHEYRLFDFRGNSKLTLDDSGDVLTHRHYSGYAQVSVDGVASSSIGFAGGAHVGELVVMGARVYDPLAGRFLSGDPVPQAINQYSYTLGNPIRFWDPDGLQQVPSNWKIDSITITETTGVNPTVSITGTVNTEISLKPLGIGISIEPGASITVTWQGDTKSVARTSSPPGPTVPAVEDGAQAGKETLPEVVGEADGVPSAENATNPPALGSEPGGNGSTAAGRDGPAGRQKGRGKGPEGGGDDDSGWSFIPPPVQFCGLGFEVVPALSMWFIVRVRRRNKLRRRETC